MLVANEKRLAAAAEAAAAEASQALGTAGSAGSLGVAAVGRALSSVGISEGQGQSEARPGAPGLQGRRRITEYVMEPDLARWVNELRLSCSAVRGPAAQSAIIVGSAE